MYVCVCKAVTDHEIRRAISDGSRSMRSLQRELGCCTGCGKCTPEVRHLLNEQTDQSKLRIPGGTSTELALA